MSSMGRSARRLHFDTGEAPKRRTPLPRSLRNSRKIAASAARMPFKFEYEADGEYERDEMKYVLDSALHALSHSPTFMHMVKACGRKNFKVIFDDTIEEYGSIDPDSKEIYISSHTTAEQLISTLAHEVRHAFQYKTAMGTETVDSLKKKDFLVWNMLIEADAASTEAQVLAEIQHLDIGPGAREAAKKLPFYRTVHRAFEEQVNRDPASLKDGRAQLAGFKRYFQTKLVGIYREGFEEYYKELREDGVTANRGIPDTAARALGWHHTGGNYLDRDPKLKNRTGQSLASNPNYIGGNKKKKGRNARMVNWHRMPVDMRPEPIPLIARPVRPSGHEGRSLRPF
jgi:hypothetical protein